MRKSSIVAFVAALVMGTVVAVPAAFAGGATATTVHSESPLVEGVTGTSTVVRNNNGVSVTFDVVGLTPGNVYSAWVFVPAPPLPPQQLAGRVVGGSGKATFAGHVAEGAVLGDAASDTVFIAIIDHGPKEPGSIRDQMTNPFTCNDGPPPCPGVIHAVHETP